MIREYIEITKPRLVSLLTYVAFVSGLVALLSGRGSMLLLILSTLSVLLGSMGANTVTCYIDRDIDEVMERTKRRPIPSGRMSPKTALYYGLTLLGISITLALATGIIWSFLWLFFGLFDNILIYSIWLKRRNPINIIAGSPSGGATVMVTWSAMTGEVISPIPLFMAMLIVAWTPVHIWSLALRFKEDYKRAKIPMLPVIVSERAAIRCIASTSIFLGIFSHIIAYYLKFTWVLNIILLLLNSGIIILSIILLFKPLRKIAWILFKYTSPYLAIVFTLFIVASL